MEKNHEYRLTFAAKLYTHIRACAAPAAAPIHALNNARERSGKAIREPSREQPNRETSLSEKNQRLRARNASQEEEEREREERGGSDFQRERVYHTQLKLSFLPLSFSLFSNGKCETARCAHSIPSPSLSRDAAGIAVATTAASADTVSLGLGLSLFFFLFPLYSARAFILSIRRELSSPRARASVAVRSG